MISRKDIIAQINAQHYAMLPISMTHNEFTKAADSFLKFLELPKESKEQLFYHIRPENRGTRTGYTLQRRAQGDTDQREYFHYNLYFEEQFKNSDLLAIPAVAEFLDWARRIYALASTLLQELLLELEEEFPGLYESYFPKHETPLFFLRFLKYDRLREGDFLAKPRYDRGGCTLALAESHPGLRIGTNAQDLRPAKYIHNYALFMPGLTFREASDERFVPVWHDVLQVQEEYVSEHIARWAIVFFADKYDIRNVSYQEAHAAGSYLETKSDEQKGK